MRTGTWRVVVEGGEVRAVEVTRQRGATPWAARAGGCASCNWRTPREAVVALVYAVQWPMREILAPGELSAEERVAAERARCAAVCREVAARQSAHLGCGAAESARDEADARSNAALECAEAIERGAVER